VRFLKERFGFGVVARHVVQLGQVIETLRCVDMFWPKDLLSDPKRFLIKRFGFGVLAHGLVQVAQVLLTAIGRKSGHGIQGARTGLIDFDVDKYVSMIFIQPMGAFGMPRPVRSIAPIRWIGIVIAKVVSASGVDEFQQGARLDH
jgi:hypothetical protein